ncbi:MAG: extracellular solute-binding protein, partial [Parvibaculaceae bacterium]
MTSFAGAAAVATLMSGTFLAPASAEEVVLKMAVPDWPPTRIMKDMFDKEYKAPSGNTVKLDIDFIPWPDFYTRVNASLTSGEQKYNMAVSDSQWLGAFVEGGYFRKINDLIDADPALKAAMDDMHENVRNAYSTYPHKTPN